MKLTKDIIEALKKIELRHYDYNIINKIRKNSITLRRLFEYECNGCTREKLPFETWLDYDRAREYQMIWVEKRKQIILKRIEKLVSSIGLYLYIQSDPRGLPVYISVNPLSNQSYHTNGVGVG